MAHPFESLFEKALARSTPEDNGVLNTAERLLEKGYARAEVVGVLKKMHQGRIDEREASFIHEAVETLEEDAY